MGPGFESNILVVLIALGFLGALAWIFRPQLKRAYRYFVAWSERDKREEQEKLKEVTLRQKAEEEVKTYFHEDTEEDQQVQKLGQ